MDDLIAFAGKRLDEEYADADLLAVQGTDWDVDEQFPSVVRSTFGHVAARCNEDELARADLRVKHVARYDPGRARREIERKRVVLAWYADAAFAARVWSKKGDAGAHVAAAGAHMTAAAEAYLNVIRGFAAEWRDHPDYRPEWAPPR